MKFKVGDIISYNANENMGQHNDREQEVIIEYGFVSKASKQQVSIYWFGYHKEWEYSRSNRSLKLFQVVT
jgi:hypothetical protein